MKKLTKSIIDIKKVTQKNEEVEKKLRDIQLENQELRSNFKTMEKEFKALEIQVKELLLNKVQNEEVDKDIKTADSEKEKTSCNKCDYVAKTEAGLKTYNTTKHKAVSLSEYTKILRK